MSNEKLTVVEASNLATIFKNFQHFKLFDATDFMEGSELHHCIEEFISDINPAFVDGKFALWTKTEAPEDEGFAPSIYGAIEAFARTETYVEGEVFSFETGAQKEVEELVKQQLALGYELIKLDKAFTLLGQPLGPVYMFAMLDKPSEDYGWVEHPGSVIRFENTRNDELIYWEDENLPAEVPDVETEDPALFTATSSKPVTYTNYGYNYGDYGYTYGYGATTYTKPYVSKKFENATEDSDLVWYAAYGSNLNEERFLRYANKERTQETEKFTPGMFTSVQATSPFRMYFAHHSATWGGGIAFLNDQEHTPEHQSNLRLWLLTRQQFWSLVCQENGGTNYTLDWEKVGVEREFLPTQTGLYSRIVTLGTAEGLPVVTCTARESFTKKLAGDTLPWQYEMMGAIKPPSVSYLNTINAGLEEMKALKKVSIDFLPLPEPSVEVEVEKVSVAR